MEKLRQPHIRYSFFIGLCGSLPVIFGVSQFSNYESKPVFFLLLFLAIVAQNAATSTSFKDKSGITYAIGPAISLAAVPFYGPGGAAIIEAAATISQWFFKPAHDTTWKRNWQQLSFNFGNSVISIFFAGLVLVFARELLEFNPILKATIPWLIAAIVNVQVNLWLLIGVIYLQQNREPNPITMWRENLWATQISIFTIGVGGGFLAFAIQRYDWVGVLIFFMPIILSAYAFRLYVTQMQAHMDNLENIVAERTEELSNLIKEKDQFLAVLTHDMKTPLTSIAIYAGLLKDHPRLATDRPDMAGVIIHSQEVLTDMVNNILDLEKLQADGNMPLNKEPLDLASLITNTVEPLLAQASSKEIDLKVAIEPIPLITELDQRQFKRVIQNLVSNAIKYTPKNGNVWVDATIKESQIIIEVKDDGYGIPEDELPYVFDRYRRVAKHQNVAAGTGLGLAITKVIVEAHDGHLSVASQEDKGSIFTVHLPLI